MNALEARSFLRKIGHPDLHVSKAEGVWYLLGGDYPKYNSKVERCLHVVRLSDLTEKVLRWKVDELMDKTRTHAYEIKDKKPFEGLKGSWLIVHKGQKVLLARRFDGSSSDPGKWNFIGGGVDKGETSRDAAIREFKEEAGYDFSDQKESIQYLLAVGNPIQGGNCYYYCIEAPDDLKIRLNYENDRWAWFDLKQVLSMVPDLNWPTAAAVGVLQKYLEPTDEH